MFDTLVMTKREKTAARTVLAFPAAVTAQVGLGCAMLLFALFSRDVIQPPPLMMASLAEAIPIQLPPPGTGHRNDVRHEERKNAGQDPKELKAPGGEIPTGIKPEPPGKDSDGLTGLGDGDDFMNGLTDPNQKPAPDGPIAREPVRTILSTSEVNAPRLVRQVAPAYPPAAIAMRLTGRVVMQIVVNEEGRVEDAQVLQSTNPIFNQAAVEAVRQWQYTRPVDVRSNQVVACYMTVAVSFTLR